MKLSLDELLLGVPEVGTARAFYAATLARGAADAAAADGPIDLHGAGTVALRDGDALAADVQAQQPAAPSGFRGYTVSYLVRQPSEVEALLEAAAASGATVLKPAKKSLFGGFSGVFQAPDGAIWKLATANKKDTEAPQDPPRPTETVVIVGVAEPKASARFYTALGMTVDRDYGNKFIDFSVAPRASRLGLMRRAALAKDAGVEAAGDGFRRVVFAHAVTSRAAVDELLAAAAAAGGAVVVAAAELERGGYGGCFADPDGNLWSVRSA